MDSYENAAGSVAARKRELGLRSRVGSPIVVGGPVGNGRRRLVATRAAATGHRGTHRRVRRPRRHGIAAATTCAELQASRDRSQALATRQAALRRVATLVAGGASPSEVFSVVAEEMARCLDIRDVGILRYEGHDAAIVVGYYGAQGSDHLRVSKRLTLEGDNLAATVLYTGRPARQESLENAAGPTAEENRALGIRAAVGVPIIVGGHLIDVSSELQEISRGIHPAILVQGGLAPAMDTLRTTVRSRSTSTSRSTSRYPTPSKSPHTTR